MRCWAVWCCVTHSRNHADGGRREPRTVRNNDLQEALPFQVEDDSAIRSSGSSPGRKVYTRMIFAWQRGETYITRWRLRPIDLRAEEATRLHSFQGGAATAARTSEKENTRRGRRKMRTATRQGRVRQRGHGGKAVGRGSQEA